MKIPQNVDLQTGKYMNKLSDFNKNYIFERRAGKKYVKIIQKYYSENSFNSDSGWSVFCFIDNEGNIYKAASWLQPAKGIRGSIFDENPPLTLSSLYKKR